MKDERYKLIFSGITGSQLYGTALPTSDTDVRGVFIPSEEFYLGFLNNVEQVESHEPDETFWEIRKFFKLCLDSNPNIIELLFIPEKYQLTTSDAWSEIILNRDIFLSTKAKHTFSGYAVSQLKRIETHRRWLLSPPKNRPTRAEFGLPENTKLVTQEQLVAYSNLTELIKQNAGVEEVIGAIKDVFGSNIIEHNSEFSIASLDALQKEKSFSNANNEFNQYQKWKEERNKDRADLESKYGYDTKHGAHLVRLLSEGKELLEKGYITFPRPDTELLRDIRGGKYSYYQLMDMIGDIDTVLTEKNSVLPHSPNRKRADALCQKLVKERLYA